MLKQSRLRQRIVIIVAFMIAVFVASHYEQAPTTSDNDEQDIEQLIQTQRSAVQVEVTGQVKKLLSDDIEPPCHQRFILELESQQTLLILHNIDLAPRIDNLAVGDSVRVYGEYIWNEQGGLVHWTHHDPNNRHPHGWVRHQSELYQ